MQGQHKKIIVGQTRRGACEELSLFLSFSPVALVGGCRKHCYFPNGKSIVAVKGSK